MINHFKADNYSYKGLQDIISFNANNINLFNKNIEMFDLNLKFKNSAVLIERAMPNILFIISVLEDILPKMINSIKQVTNIINAINKDKSKLIDIDNITDELYIKCQKPFYEAYRTLKTVKEHDRIKKIKGLTPKLDNLINLIADSQNYTNELRWAILEHDADLSPVGTTYSDINDLINDLKS